MNTTPDVGEMFMSEFTHRHEIGERLGRVCLIRQSVANRHACELCQLAS
jgi:hypothetical protein